MVDWTDLTNVGKFVDIFEVPSDLQGQNTVRNLHTEFMSIGPDKPNDIAIRVIQIPPGGEIPVHDHDTDEFTSWITCIAGSGEHIVEINDITNVHPVIQGAWTVSTQSMRTTQQSGMIYRHGFKASSDGMTLVNIYRESDITNERLKDIQQGK